MSGLTAVYNKALSLICQFFDRSNFHNDVYSKQMVHKQGLKKREAVDMVIRSSVPR